MTGKHPIPEIPREKCGDCWSYGTSARKTVTCRYLGKPVESTRDACGNFMYKERRKPC